MRKKFEGVLSLKQKVSLIFLAVFLLCLCSPVFAAESNSTKSNPTLDQLSGVAENAGLVSKSPTALIGSIIKWVLGFMGVVLAIMIIYGGILWMSAGGNTEQISKARNTIINGIIGLVIVFAAYSIARFVIEGLQTEILK